MRTLRTLLAASLTVALAFAGLAGAAPASADPPPQPFSVQNGTFYHYVRESGTTFSSITGSIQSGWYSSRGASDIRIYCPYESTGEFRGVPATDYFTTNASTGSVADFETMVDTAHAAGMTVTMYVSLILVDPGMDEFVLAQQQRAAGQSTATTQLFRWADDDAGAAPEFGGWEWSDVAQEYYATSFGYPALDFANQVTRDYAKSVLTFWLDRGVDGFEYDAPQASWGLTDADATDIMVDTPHAHGGTAKWLTAESSIANFDDPYSDSIGLTHTLFNGDDDLGSFAYDVMDGTRSADDLESHFATYLDPRRASGRGMNAAASYDLSRSASQRALDAAVTAGNGVLYSTDVEQVYSQLSDGSRAAYDEVFRAIASSSALAPDASRERVPTGADPQSYATLRTSADGSESVLAVYNFRDVAATISASLTGLDVTVPQTPTSLVTGQAAPQIASSSYAVSLPA